MQGGMDIGISLLVFIGVFWYSIHKVSNGGLGRDKKVNRFGQMQMRSSGFYGAHGGVPLGLCRFQFSPEAGESGEEGGTCPIRDINLIAPFRFISSLGEFAPDAHRISIGHGQFRICWDRGGAHWNLGRK
jgi:hypothetical protein